LYIITLELRTIQMGMMALADSLGLDEEDLEGVADTGVGRGEASSSSPPKDVFVSTPRNFSSSCMEVEVVMMDEKENAVRQRGVNQ
jgi:hypothetical protein